MTDAELVLLNSSAGLMDGLADELLIHGWHHTGEIDEGNDLLDQRDDALRRVMTAVMDAGWPGGHRSQHDPQCHLKTCPRLSRRVPWCPGCHRLPGCGHPEGRPIPSEE